MRTRSPAWVVVMVCTGVPKSVTSRRRRRPSGSEDRRNSTIRFWPCWRMSTPTWLFARSTTTRPALSLPRRKSTSRMGWVSRLRLSANCAVTPCEAVAGPATGTGSRATRSERPWIWVLYPAAERRFSTMRVRSPAWTTLTERTLPWLISTLLRPSALLAPGTSRAMRAGAWMVKPEGTAVSGWEKSMRTISVPPCMEPETACTESADAGADGEGDWAWAAKPAKAPVAITRRRNDRNAAPVHFFIVLSSLASSAWRFAPPSRHPGPGRSRAKAPRFR